MEFSFDPEDPQAVAAHRPEIEQVYARKLAEHSRLSEELSRLRTMLGDRPGPRRRRRVAPAQDRAIAALELAWREGGGTAVGPTSLHQFMIDRGLEAPATATVLGTNLWDAWKAGRIMRAPNGVYTPLDGTGRTDWDHPLTDYYFAATRGLPTPPVHRRE
jgi:hypothetical protein